MGWARMRLPSSVIPWGIRIDLWKPCAPFILLAPFLAVQIESREVGLELNRSVEAQGAVHVETALTQLAGWVIEPTTRRASARVRTSSV